jgi:hypothetical protein
MLFEEKTVTATEWFVIGSCYQGTRNEWNETKEGRKGGRGVGK